MDRRDILVPHRIFAEAGRRSRLSGKASAIREAPTFGRRASLLVIPFLPSPGPNHLSAPCGYPGSSGPAMPVKSTLKVSQARMTEQSHQVRVVHRILGLYVDDRDLAFPDTEYSL